ncbi:hypothetical protein [Paenibacillus sp. Cedars]|uniref:hypothetical protein n=1 Tax=Paenibacillus sp. Cedars TaxID=1980674 RepID=UPI001165340A|nr:hypothetical protein [Paenibacillus sp. Cedars]AWP28725.1 hypothetical protein B9D94_19755 [Paenibacillus sp. Cedars]
MLEPKTIQLVNELIQGMTRFCIQSYQSGESVQSEDISSLAELVAAINVPPDPPFERSPAFGFPLPALVGEEE